MRYHWLFWGHGASAIGNYFPYDKVRCDGCNRKTASPIWFGDEKADTLRPLCGGCASAKWAAGQGAPVPTQAELKFLTSAFDIRVGDGG